MLVIIIIIIITFVLARALEGEPLAESYKMLYKYTEVGG